MSKIMTTPKPKDPSNSAHNTKTKERTTKKPTTPEARGSDFPTSLTFNIASLQDEPQANPPNSTAQRKRRGKNRKQLHPGGEGRQLHQKKMENGNTTQRRKHHQQKRKKTAPPKGGEGRQHHLKVDWKNNTAQRKRRPSSTTQPKREEKSSPTQRRGRKAAPPVRRLEKQHCPKEEETRQHHPTEERRKAPLSKGGKGKQHHAKGEVKSKHHPQGRKRMASSTTLKERGKNNATAKNEWKQHPSQGRDGGREGITTQRRARQTTRRKRKQNTRKPTKNNHFICCHFFQIGYVFNSFDFAVLWVFSHCCEMLVFGRTGSAKTFEYLNVGISRAKLEYSNIQKFQTFLWFGPPLWGPRRSQKNLNPLKIMKKKKKS